VIDDATIPPIAIMQPGDYVIIARNATTFAAEYYPDAACTVVNMTTISLWNSGGLIDLEDSSSTIISSLDYTVYANADMAKKNNKTLERNAAGGWEESLVDGGTPCAENSVAHCRSRPDQRNREQRNRCHLQRDQRGNSS
jgi:hypothetical protein